MIDKKRILKALVVGAVLGVTYEFIVNPLINKPVEEAVDKVVE